MKKVLFFAGSLFVLMACSKDQGIESDRQDSAVAMKGAASPGEQEWNTVHIRNSSFSPDSLTVNINNTVSWKNDDAIAHTVTSDKFDSGDMPPGSTFKLYFDNTGSYYYFCKNHNERGVIVVTGIR